MTFKQKLLALILGPIVFLFFFMAATVALSILTEPDSILGWKMECCP